MQLIARYAPIYVSISNLACWKTTVATANELPVQLRQFQTIAYIVDIVATVVFCTLYCSRNTIPKI